MDKLNLRNQNGSSLVIVLLMITVFFVLGLSIVSSALTNTKQVNKTEKEMQALDLAEMGVRYYQNHFKEKTYRLIESAINDPNNDTYDQKVKAIKNLKNILTKEKLINDLENNVQYSIADDAEYNINIKNVSSDEQKVLIEIASTGIKNSDTQQTIDATIELSIEKLIKDMNTPGNGNDDLPIPSGLNSCTYTENTLLGDGCLYENIPGTAIFSGFIEEPKKTDIYINGNAQIGSGTTITGGIKQESRIDINGDADFGKISGGIKQNTIININGTANFGTIEGGIKQNSIININGDANFGTIDDGIKQNSIININGDATFEPKEIGIQGESKICVGGKIKLKRSVLDVVLNRVLSILLGNSDEGIYSYLEDSEAYNAAGCPPLNHVNNGDAQLTLEPQTLANNATIISTDYQ